MPHHNRNDVQWKFDPTDEIMAWAGILVLGLLGAVLVTDLLAHVARTI